VFTNGWIRSWLGSFERYSTAGAPKVGGHPVHGHSHDQQHEHHDRRQLTGPCRGGSSTGGMHVHDAEGARCHQHRGFQPGGCQHHRTSGADLSLPLLQLHSELRLGAARRATNRAADDSQRFIGNVSVEVVGAGLVEVTMHEVGHTLGLRHNFVASVNRSFVQLLNRSFTQANGLADSVMDYLPVNLLSSKAVFAAGADVAKAVDYFNPVVGAYDKFAILWGYSSGNDDAPPGPDIVPVEPLSQQQLAATGPPFASDYDVLDENPVANRFDLGDPLLYFADRLDLVRELRPGLAARSVLAGESWTGLLPAELTLVGAVQSAGKSLAKYVGGVLISRARPTVAGDGTTHLPVRAVPLAEQQRALALILGIVAPPTDDRTAGGLLMDPSVYTQLVEHSGSCSGLQTYCLGLRSVDAVSWIQSTQRVVLDELVTNVRLRRLRQVELAETAPSATVLSTAYLLQNVTDSLWGDSSTLARAVCADCMVNWQLQRHWVQMLVGLANVTLDVQSKDGELLACASAQLLRLQGSLQAARSGGSLVSGADGHVLATLLMLQRWQGNAASVLM